MNDVLEDYKHLLKSFKVEHPSDLLRAKGKAPKGRKDDKAKDVAWMYTAKAINDWKAAQTQIRHQRS